MATDVAGSFSILNSTFFSHIQVNYSLCINQLSNLKFSNDRFYGKLNLESRCSQAQILITDSIFDLKPPLHHGIGQFTMTSSLLVNTISMVVPKCSKNSLKLMNIVVTSSITLDTNCTVLIEDSVFAFGYQLLLQDSSGAGSSKDKLTKATLNNVTFANCTGGVGRGATFVFVAVILVNCTLENNIGSALVTA